MAPPMLEVSHLRVSYSGVLALSDVSLTVPRGQIVALVGGNGNGKSTTLRAIAGLVPCTGRISLDGRNLSALSRRERARMMAYLPQGHQVHWPLLARDVVALGRHPHGLADPARLTAEHGRAIAAAMARTGTCAFGQRPIMDLSGGERARVMLARVLAVELDRGLVGRLRRRGLLGVSRRRRVVGRRLRLRRDGGVVGRRLGHGRGGGGNDEKGH